MESPAERHSANRQSLSRSFLSPPPSRDRGRHHSGVTAREEQEGVKKDSNRRARKTGLITVYGNKPQVDDDWIFDLDDNPPRKLDAEDIKMELYRRECRQLNVTPVGAYIRSPSSPTLSIRHYLLGPRGAKALAVPLLLDSCITSLNLERNSLGAEGVRYLMEPLMESCSITSLNLSHNELGSMGAAIMGKVLMANNLLRSVTLAGNQFRDSDADHFVQVLLERKILKELNLSENELGDGAASKLGHAISTNDSLESLDLSWNHIRPRGGVALLNGVKENVGLKRLRVSHNGVGDEGCAAAGAALANNSSLLELDMASNRITNAGMSVLASQLKHNETLQELKLGDNLATGRGAQGLVEAIFAAEDCAIHTLDLANINVWDSLTKLVQEHAESRPLKLVHSKVTREEKPRDELEQQIKDEIMAATRARDEARDDSGFTPAHPDAPYVALNGDSEGERVVPADDHGVGGAIKDETKEADKTADTAGDVSRDEVANGGAEDEDEFDNEVENLDTEDTLDGTISVDDDQITEDEETRNSGNKEASAESLQTKTSSDLQSEENAAEGERTVYSEGLAEEEDIPSGNNTPTGDGTYVNVSPHPSEGSVKGKQNTPQPAQDDLEETKSQKSLKEDVEGEDDNKPGDDASDRNSGVGDEDQIMDDT